MGITSVLSSEKWGLGISDFRRVMQPRQSGGASPAGFSPTGLPSASVLRFSHAVAGESSLCNPPWHWFYTGSVGRCFSGK